MPRQSGESGGGHRQMSDAMFDQKIPHYGTGEKGLSWRHEE